MSQFLSLIKPYSLACGTSNEKVDGKGRQGGGGDSTTSELPLKVCLHAHVLW